MATINRLVTQLIVDPAPMEQGFARGLSSVDRFAAGIAPLLLNALKNPARFQSAGEVSAQKIIDGLQRVLSADTSTLREALARGALSPAQFTQLAAQGGKAYNDTLLNTIDKLAAHNAISPDQRAQLIASLKDVGQAGGEAAATGLTAIGTKLRSLGRDATQFGIEFGLAVSLPIAAGAKKAIQAAEEISHALDSIGVATGAIGPQLGVLEHSFDNLFKQLPNSAADIGKAISGISVATGATGPALEALATQVLNLSRITGTDLQGNVQATQRAFKAWGTDTADQVRNLDTLFKVSQLTGVSTQSLAETLAHFAPALRQFGLSFDQSASLIGQFEKNGIAADVVLQSMQTSLSKFAEKGLTGAQGLQLLVDTVKKAGSDAEAVNLASRILGPRQAAQFTAAVRTGAIDIQSLTDKVRASATTINDTAARTDTFASAMSDLHHATETASAAIGATLERAFLSIAPVLTLAAHGIGEIATAFNKLPAFVTNTIVGLLGLLAVIGPLALAFAAVAKATGAVALAIGVVRSLIGTAVLGSLSTEATAVGGAMVGAAAGTNALAAGVALLGRTTGIGLALSIVAIAVGDIASDARAAEDEIQKFRDSLVGLSDIELRVKTDELTAQIDALQKRIDDLRGSASPPEGFFAGLGRAISDAGAAEGGLLTGPSLDASNLAAAQGDLQTRLDETNKALKTQKDLTQKNADAMVAFNAKVAQVIGTEGHHLTLDADGNVEGKLSDLNALADKLNKQLHSQKKLEGFDVTAAKTALEDVQSSITKLKNDGGPALGDIFDQLSPDLEVATKQVQALIGRANALPHAFQQLSDIKLSGSILRDLDTLNARLDQVGRNSATENANRVRDLIKQLQGTLAGQIGGAHPGDSAFEVTVTGRVKRIEVDPGAGADLLRSVQEQLVLVHNTAAAAAAAELNLQAAQSSGDLQRIADATVATEHAYSVAREAQDLYTRSVNETHAASDATRVAIETMLKTASETGASQANIASARIGVSEVDPAEISRIHDSIKSDFQQFGPIALQVLPTIDRVALERVATEASKVMQRAQVDSLAGDTGTAAAESAQVVDELARRIQAIANAGRGGGATGIAVSIKNIEAAAKEANVPVTQLQEAISRLTEAGQQKLAIDLTKLSGDADKAAGLQAAFIDQVALSVQSLAREALAGRVGAFEELQDKLKQTGVSAEQVAASLDKMTATGRILSLANAFAEVASAIFGVQSAIGGLVASFAKAITAGVDLVKTIHQIHAENAQKDGGDGGGVGGLFSSLGNVAKIIPVIGNAISGVISAVKSIGSIFSSLFGESKLQKEHDAILAANNAALKQLAVSLDRQAGTGGRQADLARAVAAAQQRPFTVSDQALFPEVRRDAAGFAVELSKYGLTVDQADAAAKALNITLFDSKHHLVGLAALADALAAQAKILTTLGDDLSSQQKLLAARASLAGGNQTAQEKLNDSVTAIAKVLDSQGGTLGAALQKAASEGPAALRKALSTLVDQIQAGTLSLGQLGGFQNVTDLLDAITGTSDAINALGDATNGAVDAMLNVPAGFKKALVEFNAQLPQTGPTAPQPPAPPPPKPTDTSPTQPPPSATQGPLLALVKAVTDTFTAPLADAVSSPVDALQALTVSATDVAKALDAMFHMEHSASGAGSSSGPIVGGSRLDLEEFRQILEGSGGSGGGGGHVTINGDVLIDARTKPIDQAFDEFAVFAQRRAQKETGDSTQILTAFQRARR